MSDGYVEQLPDRDADETTEWIDSLNALVDAEANDVLASSWPS